jgi:hypothetical protein
MNAMLVLGMIALGGMIACGVLLSTIRQQGPKVTKLRLNTAGIILILLLAANRVAPFEEVRALGPGIAGAIWLLCAVGAGSFFLAARRVGKSSAK